jgi:vacuolar protein sorting-associated protein 26
MAYFFASPVDVDIKLDGEELRKQVDIKGEKDKITQCSVYYDGDSVNGQVRLWSYFAPKTACLIYLQVTIRVRDGKRITHEGIKVEFVGTIGMSHRFSFLQLSSSIPRRTLL